MRISILCLSLFLSQQSLAIGLEEYLNLNVSDTKNGNSLPAKVILSEGETVFLLSAKNSDGLKRYAESFIEFLKEIGIENSLSENDLLFTRYNGSIDFVGVCGRVPMLKESLYYHY